MEQKQINQNINNNLNTFYFDILDLWKKLCLEHTELFDTTCEEYSLLLTSDIDALDSLLTKKEAIIKRINELDVLRKHIINRLNTFLSENSITIVDKVQSVSDLVQVFKKYELTQGENFLQRYNQLLINVIEKIQLQNKKNQIFLNKSIISLKEIREGLLGRKSYNTYNSMGVANNMPSIK